MRCRARLRKAHVANNIVEVYLLLLDPLPLEPYLTKTVISDLKRSLGGIFESVAQVREVIVAAREVLDNVLTHADWDRQPLPSFCVQYRLSQGHPQVCISSTNTPKDIDEAAYAVTLIREYVTSQGSPALDRELTAHLVAEASIGVSGGIGLLQVASSPRCHLDAQLEDAVFHVRVDVDVPELSHTQT